MQSSPILETEVENEKIDDLLEYHWALAKLIWPAGAVLRCPKCDHRQTATVDKIANYLAHGWPTCHGETMWVCDPETNEPEASTLTTEN